MNTFYKIHSWLLPVIFLCLNGGIHAQDNQIFLVYGSKHTIGVDLPKTWTVDMQQAKTMGIAGFFHPNAYSLSNTPLGLMLILVPKDTLPEFEIFVKNDTALYAKDFPGSLVEELEWGITRQDGYKVIVYKLFRDDIIIPKEALKKSSFSACPKRS
jgi:hypothetical protein